MIDLLIDILKKGVIIFVFIALSVHCIGQQSNVFRYLTKKDGLSQMAVFAIAQDKSGFIWFGTRDGLNKYDGYQFKVYSNSVAANSLVSNDVRVIYKDDDTGDLWIGTTDGLSRYRPKTDDFENYKYSIDPKSITSNEILSIFKDNKKRLWVGTAEGLNLFEPKTKNFKRLMYGEMPEDSFYKIHIEFIIQDHEHVIWLGTDRGLYYIEEKNGFKFVRKDGKGTELSLTNDIVKTLLIDTLGNMWIGNYEGGLHYWDRKARKTISFQHNKNQPNSLSNNSVRALAFDQKGHLWIGTFDGLNIYDPKTQSFEIFKKTDSGALGLSDASVKSIYRDNRGGMWVGTYYGGVNHTDPNYHRFQNFVHSPYNEGLSADVVSSFVEDHHGNLWIGTEGGGLNFFNAKSGKYTSYKSQTEIPNTISGNNVKQLLLDGDSLWIGTFSQGLNLFNLRTRTFEYFKSTSNSKNELTNNNVYGLYKEGNDLWILTYGGGLVIYSIKSKMFSSYRNIVNNKKSLSSDLCRVILKTRDGTMWIGTENGINKVVKDAFGRPISFLSYLNNEKVYTLFEDENDKLWVGTISSGLFCFDPKDGSSKQYTIAEGLPGNTIYGILADDDNYLWMSTNFGLAKFDPTTKIFTNYNASSGLENTEYNYNAYLKTRDGDLLFGGINGFTRFNPKDIKPNYFIPPVAFTKLKQSNKVVHPDDESDILSQSINDSKTITFPYNEANFTIGFAALDYFSPKNNHYAYMLEGLDKDWINTVGETEASYTIQKEGTYLFKIKGGNSDGLWNQQERTIQIIVLPPPWRSWWAYLLYTAFIIFTGVALYRYLRLQHSLELENIARQQQDALHEMKLRFFTNITHELRTPLTLILGPLKELVSIDQSQEVRQKLTMIEKNTNRLLNLVNQVLIFRKLATDHEPLNISKGDIVHFLYEIFLPFQEAAKAKEIDYSFQASEQEIYLYFDEEKIEKVFFNLLANAFKFTPAKGKIKMEIIKSSEDVKIQVSDTGIGVEDEFQEQIFQRFYEKKHPQFSEIKGTGIGLAISKQMVELHHGKITLQSEYGEGAIFTVHLPQGIHHFTPEELQHMGDDMSKSTREMNEIKSQFLDMAKGKDIVENPTSSVKAHHNAPLILIVEDNVEVRQYIVQLFEGEYRIVEAENGEVGLIKAKKYSPDIIISDVMMPVMDGITMASTLKADIEISHIPIILLTARSAALFKIEGLTVGADDYITKPFDPEELKLRVRNILFSRREMKEKFGRVLNFDPKDIDITSADEVFLVKAMELVEANIDNYEYNVEKFAEDLAVSRPLLFTKLKALTDQTPNNFIKTIRLKRSAQLLLKQNLNVSEVAYMVGFKDPKYFRKCFQAQFEMPPSDYAKSMEN